jgi:glyoxylase-like metal-dependent hydrolase (beta-lactamase superfamily II)
MKRYTAGPFATNCYLDGSILIDTPPGSFDLIKEPITHILLTHSHWDHTADLAKFLEKFPNVVIASHPDDIGNIKNPGSDGLPLMFAIEGVEPTLLVREGDVIEGLQVVELPGHTPGGVGYYDPKRKILFSGDTLFQGTIGNLSLPTARPDLMWKSLKKLAKLPPDTLVLPGHGDPTTIGDEDWLDRAEQVFG